jgi:hypothetical protein
MTQEQEQEQPKQERLEQHQLAGMALEKIIPPEQMVVRSNPTIMSHPPRGDVLLLRRIMEWTEELCRCLPDGIRYAVAIRLLLEFKISESVNWEVFRQVVGYDIWSRRHLELSADDTQLQCILISAKTTQRSTREKFGYLPTDLPGVYRSSERFFEHIPLILLNQLRREEHNALFKFFGSIEKEQEWALDILSRVPWMPKETYWHLLTIHSIRKTGGDMTNLTREFLAEWTSQLQDRFISVLPVEKVMPQYKASEVLSRYKPEEVLSHYQASEVLSHYQASEVLSHYQPQERLAGLKPQERLAGLKPEEVFSHYKPEEILAGLKAEDRQWLAKLLLDEKRLSEEGTNA